MVIKRAVTPFFLPVAAFAATIFLGSVLLWLDVCAKDGPVSYVDALFISTSAVCVTGLASVDPSTVFTPVGHVVMLVLIQLGGLGIMTYSALLFYVFSRHISLDNRLSVSYAILSDTSFHLGHFLQRLILTVFCIEGIGAVLLYTLYNESITPFHALFLAVSAFCNAGFALWPSNLIAWEQTWGFNGIIMFLIVVGGIGFIVIDEMLRALWPSRRRWRSAHGIWFSGGERPHKKISYQSRLVLTTSLALIIAGTVTLLLFEMNNPGWGDRPAGSLVLPALFQSVTARTAGFATVDLTRMTDISLLMLVVLMFIGGSPGSCAGGIKTTTFRALLGYVRANVLGAAQVVVAGKALDAKVVSRVMLLFFFSMLIVVLATFILMWTENGAAQYGAAPMRFLDVLFETVSAFGTVGLSLNITPKLTPAGKVVLCFVMFIGRLGPIWLLTTMNHFHTDPKYRLPETDIPIG